MPIALMLTLCPTTAARVPASLARAAHAAVLRLFGAADPALATRLHDEEGPKPLTVSNVLGMDAHGPSASVTPAQTYGLRITLLAPATEALAVRWLAEGLGAIELDGLAWEVRALTADAAAHPWAGSVSYEGLAAPALHAVAQRPATRWTLEFAAPVTFRQRGLNMPLPTPELVFGSLLEKWNAWSSLPLAEELRQVVAAQLAISRFDLRSEAVPTKGGALQIGALGRCTYTATTREPYWLACLDILARYAFYSGVGAGTARGLGRARLLPEGRR